MYSQADLIQAIQTQNQDLVSIILKDKDFHPKKFSAELLQASIQVGNLAIFKILLADTRIDLAINKNQALQQATQLNQPKMVTALLETKNRGVRASANNYKSLLTAVRNHFTPIVSSILTALDTTKNASGNFSLPFREAIAQGNLEMVKLFLGTPLRKLELKKTLYNAFKKALELNHPEIASEIVGTGMLDFDKALTWAVNHNHASVVEKLFEMYPNCPLLPERYIKDAAKQDESSALITALINSNKFNHEKLLTWAVATVNVNVVRLLLAHPNTDPTFKDNISLTTCIKAGQENLVELFLNHPKTTLSYFDNFPIRSACYHGQINIIKLLLKNQDKGLDLSVQDNYCLKIAAEQKHIETTRLLLPLCSVHKLKFSEIFEANHPNLLQEITDYFDHPESYISEHPNLSTSQKLAFEILQLKTNIYKWEKEERTKFSANPENAMDDETVTRSKWVFERKLLPTFTEKFLSYAQLEAEHEPAPELKAKEISAIIHIEQKIRELLLDRILAENPKKETLEFIETNKLALMQATNSALMAQARDEHFNSTTNTNHLAWRGYDAEAPYKGTFDNLLTPPKNEQALFATAASRMDDNPLMNSEASLIIRKMVSYYFILVNDLNEGIENRISNFISELADMRSAHSDDYKNRPDAPSCYPGYLGRTLNMGFEHPLTKETVSTKLFIANTLETFVFSKFKEQLEACENEEAGQNLLAALTLMSETGWRAQNIFSGLEKFDEPLLTIRKAFIQNLGSQNDILERINAALEAQDRPHLKTDDEFNEQCYAFQYLLDPARGNLAGHFSAEYHRWIKKFYPEVTPEKANLSTPNLSQWVNPYSTPIKQLEGLLALQKNNLALFNAYSKRLDNIKTKASLFNSIKESLISLPIYTLEKYSNQSYSLFCEVLTEVMINLENNISEHPSEYLNQHLWPQLDLNFKNLIEAKLTDYSDNDAMIAALDILTELERVNEPDPADISTAATYTPIMQFRSPHGSPSKKSSSRISSQSIENLSPQRMGSVFY